MSTAVPAALCLSVLGAAVAGAVPAVSTAPVALRAAAADDARQMLALVNDERARAGCSPVRLDPRLNAAAAKHSQDMADHDYFSHVGRDGSTFVSRMEEEGYPAPRAENIAAGSSTAQGTLQQWMHSSGHRTNILDCTVTAMGVGVGAAGGSEYGTYWTQDFGLTTTS